MTRSPRWRTFALLVLVLWATVMAQSLALAAEEHHHSAPDHCCLLCHLGPLPALHSATPIPGIPLVGIAYRTTTEPNCPLRGAAPAATSSRAPPG